tara:strand:- start:926 stop:1054 length:129 start_codon:yes stop_codon:yes gene_type:complete
MYAVSTATETVRFDSFELAWTYSQQVAEAFTITFDPAKRNNL